MHGLALHKNDKNSPLFTDATYENDTIKKKRYESNTKKIKKRKEKKAIKNSSKIKKIIKAGCCDKELDAEMVISSGHQWSFFIGTWDSIFRRHMPQARRNALITYVVTQTTQKSLSTK